jgi:hypothetical protein
MNFISVLINKVVIIVMTFNWLNRRVLFFWGLQAGMEGTEDTVDVEEMGVMEDVVAMGIVVQTDIMHMVKVLMVVMEALVVPEGTEDAEVMVEMEGMVETGEMQEAVALLKFTVRIHDYSC